MTTSTEILADWHLLGSSGGYRTLAATSGVTKDESAQLEQFDSFRDLVGGAQEALQNSVCAFLHRLGSGRLAIRRVLPDRVPDNYGRRSIVVASLVLSPEEYAAVAAVDAGRDGNGLEGIVCRKNLWERLIDARNSKASKLALPLPRRPELWTVHEVDFAILEAWRSSCVSGRRPGVRIRRGSDHEARLLAFPSLLPKSQVTDFLWGIGIMRAAHPGVIASYLVPEFEPGSAAEVPGALSNRVVMLSRNIMRRFPESELHSDAEFRALQKRLDESTEEVRKQREWVGEERKNRDKVENELREERHERQEAERKQAAGYRNRIDQLQAQKQVLLVVSGTAVFFVLLLALILVLQAVKGEPAGSVAPPPAEAGTSEPVQPPAPAAAPPATPAAR